MFVTFSVVIKYFLLFADVGVVVVKNKYVNVVQKKGWILRRI